MCSVFSSVLCKQPALSSEGTGRTHFKVRNSLSSILWEEMVIPLFHEALCIADEILFVWSCVWYDLQQRHFGRHLLIFFKIHWIITIEFKAFYFINIIYKSTGDQHFWTNLNWFSVSHILKSLVFQNKQLKEI